MRMVLFSATVLIAAAGIAVRAQEPADLAVFEGLGPFSALPNTDAGRAALGANLRVTGGVQNGTLEAPLLEPFAVQQEQALKDAAITAGNLAQLSDGLGTALGAAYLARFHQTGSSTSRPLPPAAADLVSFATGYSGARSAAAKMFFANGTREDGTTPVSAAALAIVTAQGGVFDVMGRAYGLPAGSPGANRFGDSRPFQTEPVVAHFTARDYFGQLTDNTAYNRGPKMNLVDSPSFPSGHTTYGFTGALLLGLLAPERMGQMFARGAEYGTDRMVVGAHYAMDVIGGRTLALYEVAHLLAGAAATPASGSAAGRDFPAALKEARRQVRAALEAACGQPVAACAAADSSRFSNTEANRALVLWTMTYGLPVVYAQNAAGREDVGKLAPEAGNLLTAAFPGLTLEEADQILTETEGPGGGFLDNGSGFGVYSRLNLEAAAERVAER